MMETVLRINIPFDARRRSDHTRLTDDGATAKVKPIMQQ
jgi:hypothetical protein